MPTTKKKTATAAKKKSSSGKSSKKKSVLINREKPKTQAPDKGPKVENISPTMERVISAASTYLSSIKIERRRLEKNLTRLGIFVKAEEEGKKECVAEKHYMLQLNDISDEAFAESVRLTNINQLLEEVV